MIDHLHGYSAGLRLVEGPGRIAVERGPGICIDFGFKGGLECLIGIVRPEEVGVADEETLLAVIGIDEPAGELVRVAPFDLPELWLEHIDPLHPYLYLPIGRI